MGTSASAGPSGMIDESAELGIVGVGAIAQAIVTGLCEGADAAPSILLSARNAERAAALADRFPSVRVAEDNQAVLERASLVLLCLRPQDAHAVLGELAFPADRTVISVMAGIDLDALRRLAAPGRIAARALALPAVARRAGLTAIYPADERAGELFGRLGGTLTVADEHSLEALWASTGTIAAHLEYLRAIGDWLVARGIAADDATRYVAGLFAAVADELDDEPHDLAALAREHATRGGINERFAGSLRRAGMLDAVPSGLDEIAAWLAGR